jgi:hypothetical protein
MPYAGGENPKVGDIVKHPSRGTGTVFELDLQANKAAKEQSVESEKIKVKFDDGTSTTDFAREFKLIKRASE